MNQREQPIASFNESEQLREVSERIRKDNERYHQETGRQKLVFTQTFGCPMV